MIIFDFFLDSVDAIRKCLVKGFFSQAAHYHYSGDYVTIKEEYHFKVYKGSAIMYRKEFPKWYFTPGFLFISLFIFRLEYYEEYFICNFKRSWKFDENYNLLFI